MNDFLTIKNLTRQYPNEDHKVLNDINFDINQGDFKAIVGQSGSGKSTLLNIIAGLDKADIGEVFFNGKSLERYTEKQINEYRNKNIGIIYQFHNLLEDFSVLENVMLPALINISKKEAKKEAMKLLNELGLNEKLNKYPQHLSGGEKQRVAIARALINKPKLLLADEPTGSLDSKNADNVFNIFKELNEKKGLTIIFITHDIELAKKTNSVLNIKDGKIYEH